MNIELITDKALIEELSSRFDTMVFVGLRDHANEDTVEKFRWKGDCRRCQGLIFGMVNRIDAARQEATEQIEGD